MPEDLTRSLELVARGLEITGASAMIIGFVVATLHCLRRCLREGVKAAMARYRHALGRVVLTGLEILVAATIIWTVTLKSTAENMALLAIMVAVRTGLGWTMTLETYGRWPWQRSRPSPPS